MANVHVLAIHGEIDISRKQWIEQELAQIEHFGPNATTILDLTDVRYLDTTFLNALDQIRTRLNARQAGSSVCIAAPSNRFVARLFEFTKTKRVFHVFDDLPAARRYAYFHTPPAIF